MLTEAFRMDHLSSWGAPGLSEGVRKQTPWESKFGIEEKKEECHCRRVEVTAAHFVFKWLMLKYV